MAATKQITKVPFSIEAPDEITLTERCIQNNRLNDTEFDYYQIYKDGNRIIAWFRADAKKYKRLP